MEHIRQYIKDAIKYCEKAGREHLVKILRSSVRKYIAALVYLFVDVGGFRILGLRFQGL